MKEEIKEQMINFKDITRSYPQSIFNKKAYNIKIQQRFIKLSLENMLFLSQESFTTKELQLLDNMLCFLKLDKISSGVLQYNGIPLNKTTLQSLLIISIDKNTFDDCIKRLEIKELIKRVKLHNGTIYFVNPFVFMVGESIDPITFALFYQSKWNRTQQ